MKTFAAVLAALLVAFFIGRSVLGQHQKLSLEPAVSSGPRQSVPSNDASSPSGAIKEPRQPSAADLSAFFKASLPSVVKLTELKADPPVRMADTSSDDNAWIVNVKLTLTPVEDLLAVPSPEDARITHDLADQLLALVRWGDAYGRSPYARAYGEFKVDPPPSPTPQLVVIRQKGGQPMAPLYGKVAAEWQVDHWLLSNLDVELPPMGQPLASFTGGPVMVKDGPEARAFLTAERKAITDATQRRSAIEQAYLQDLTSSTKPGTVYKGKIAHRLGVLPCEVRFLEPSGGDAGTARFEVTLTGAPTYQLIFSGKMVVPSPFDSSDSSTSGAFSNVSDESAPTPFGNLIVNFSSGGAGGKDEDGKTLPGMLVRGQKGRYTPRDQPFLILDHQLRGLVSRYAQGEFVLTADQQR